MTCGRSILLYDQLNGCTRYLDRLRMILYVSVSPPYASTNMLPARSDRQSREIYCSGGIVVFITKGNVCIMSGFVAKQRTDRHKIHEDI
jgi:hypothetical protein